MPESEIPKVKASSHGASDRKEIKLNGTIIKLTQ
jgi:hypothetical protein